MLGYIGTECDCASTIRLNRVDRGNPQPRQIGDQLQDAQHQIAKTRLQSEDSLFRHKTTRREPYEAARAEFSKDEADEVILLNERGEVCEGTITNIFAEAADGILLTPPLTSGLLPGVLRAELIRERPLAAFGVAFAAGWIIAKLARSGDK